MGEIDTFFIMKHEIGDCKLFYLPERVALDDIDRLKCSSN